jgi:hypothetical protein
MLAVIGTLVFVGAMALALGTIWSTVAPQWRRIARLAAGHVEQPFHPLETLARAERRIAVRRWSAGSPVPAQVSGWPQRLAA